MDFWSQLFGGALIAGISILAGVPFAIHINRSSKNESDSRERQNLCLMIHRALEAHIKAVDDSVSTFKSGNLPSARPYVAMLDDTFAIRYSLIDDAPLLELIDTVAIELNHLRDKLDFVYAGQLSFLGKDHQTVASSLRTTSVFAIGHEKFQTFSQTDQNEKSVDDVDRTDTGVNEACIKAIIALEDYMIRHEIAFKKWNPNRRAQFLKRKN